MSRRDYKPPKGYTHYIANTDRDIAEYGKNTIRVKANERWNYAIPENYVNFQDGFIWQVVPSTRGMPIVNYNGTTLYFYRNLSLTHYDQGLSEFLLLYDRNGNKYTFLVEATNDAEEYNPSYYEFIKNVKKYTPSLKTKIKKYLSEKKGENQ